MRASCTLEEECLISRCLEVKKGANVVTRYAPYVKLRKMYSVSFFELNSLCSSTTFCLFFF